MVRDITNMSKGTFGAHIGRAILETWRHKLVFLHAKDSKTPFSLNADFAEDNMLNIAEETVGLVKLWTEHGSAYSSRQFRNFDDYEATLFGSVASFRPDVIVLAAAVSDYGVVNYVDGKIRSADSQDIQLAPLPKLIGSIRAAAPDAVLVGFKLLVNSDLGELVEAAHKSCLENDCDLVIANDLSDIKRGDHQLTVVRNQGGTPVFNRYFQSDNADRMHLARCVVKEIDEEIKAKAEGK